MFDNKAIGWIEIDDKLVKNFPVNFILSPALAVKDGKFELIEMSLIPSERYKNPKDEYGTTTWYSAARTGMADLYDVHDYSCIWWTAC